MAAFFEPIWRSATPLVVRFGFFAIIVAGGVGAWRIALASPYFQVRVVEADETLHMGRQRILALTGLLAPTNIFEFDCEAATAALKAEPWIADAKVKKALPGKVEVSIREREPAGVVPMGDLYLLDSSGRPFVKASLEEAALLPFITGLDRRAYVADEAAAEERFRGALALVRLYRQSPLAALRPLSNVHIAEGGRLELLLGRTRVSLGRQDHGLKLERLLAVHHKLIERNADASYILMDGPASADDRVVIREVPLPVAAGGDLK